MRQLLSLLARVGAVLLVTLLLLEGLAQAMWWQRDCVTLSGKELCLLPYPILTESHLEILSNLEAAERGQQLRSIRSHPWLERQTRQSHREGWDSV